MASIIKVNTIKDTSDNTLLTSSSGNVSISNDLSVSGDLSVTGNVPTSNTSPAFRAYKGSADQSLTPSTFTKVTYDTVDFDTNSNFDTSTSRFTPTVAGYYQINVILSAEGAVGLTRFISEIYKNGSSYSRFSDLEVSSGTIGRDYSGSDVIYFNGTTDYIEIYSFQVATTPNLESSASGTQQIISGFLARAV